MIINLYKPSLNELTHYGVLGMKWGRRKRVETETSIKLKTNIKEAEKNYKKEVNNMNRETLGGLKTASKETLKKVQKSYKEIEYAKEDYKNNKILEKFKGVEKNKSQIAMEEKYKEKGLSNDEATIAAYQHLKTKKMLMAIGTTAIVAGAGYAAYKIHDNKIDKIIKSDKILQNISTDSSKGIRDAFYSSGNRLDNSKYKGIYGKSLNNPVGILGIPTGDKQDVHAKSIKVLSDIKQASRDNAKKTLEEIVKNDPEFVKNFNNYIDNNSRSYGAVYWKKFDRARNSLNNNVVDKNVYEVFNAALVDHSPGMQPLTDKFFNKLTEKGYNAIKDINDSKYSGYKSLNPIIAFNTSGKVSVIDVKKLAESEINKSAKIAYGHIIGTELIKTGSAVAATMLGNNAIKSKIKSNNENKIVEEYKKKHPNTEMSFKEIVRAVERGN